MQISKEVFEALYKGIEAKFTEFHNLRGEPRPKHLYQIFGYHNADTQKPSIKSAMAEDEGVIAHLQELNPKSKPILPVDTGKKLYKLKLKFEGGEEIRIGKLYEGIFCKYLGYSNFYDFLFNNPELQTLPNYAEVKDKQLRLMGIIPQTRGRSFTYNANWFSAQHGGTYKFTLEFSSTKNPNRYEVLAYDDDLMSRESKQSYSGNAAATPSFIHMTLYRDKKQSCLHISCELNSPDPNNWDILVGVYTLTSNNKLISGKVALYRNDSKFMSQLKLEALQFINLDGHQTLLPIGNYKRKEASVTGLVNSIRLDWIVGIYQIFVLSTSESLLTIMKLSIDQEGSCRLQALDRENKTSRTFRGQIRFNRTQVLITIFSFQGLQEISGHIVFSPVDLEEEKLGQGIITGIIRDQAFTNKVFLRKTILEFFPQINISPEDYSLPEYNDIFLKLKEVSVVSPSMADKFSSFDTQSPNNLTYVFYYYNPSEMKVLKGLLVFGNVKRVVLEIYPPDYQKIHVVWSGTYERIGNLLFLSLFLQDDHSGQTYPSMQLYTLDNSSEWNTYYTGSFLGLKRDRKPFGGLGFIEKTTSRDKALKMLVQPVDPRISYFLQESSFKVESTPPISLDNLISDAYIEYFVGKYSLFYRNLMGEIRKSKVEFTLDRKVKIVSTHNGSTNSGKFFNLEKRYFEAIVRVLNSKNEPTGVNTTLIGELDLGNNYKCLPGLGVGRGNSGVIYSFPFLMISETTNCEAEEIQLQIQKYFEIFDKSNLEAPSHDKKRDLLTVLNRISNLKE